MTEGTSNPPQSRAAAVRGAIGASLGAREHPPRRLAVRALNALGEAALRAGVPGMSLDERVLLEAARQRTGLGDFGDEAFREPLRILLRSYDREANLNFVGRVAARIDTLRLLVNRLHLEEDRKRYPGIAEQQIRRPLFIVGLPRTGSTLLHSLLAQDPANRVPMTWEVMHPSPPPRLASYDSDPRIAKVDKEMTWLDVLAPDFKTIHPVSARRPQECIAITSHAFISPQFHTTHIVPSYRAWLDQHGFALAYPFHRRFLQHLQWRCSGERWVLKSPAHLFGLEALFETYPDAGIIQTHRDPLKVLPSVASLSAVLQGAFSHSIDPLWIGSEVTERWAEGVERLIRARESDRIAADRFVDVHYRDVVRDPMATVRRIYRHFGLPLTAEAEARMKRFVADNPKDKHGEHNYSLARFGLDPRQVQRRYRAYREFFAIERESAAA